MGQFERIVETCISPYVKLMTSASSKREAGYSKLVLWITQRDGVGEEVGGASEWETHVYPWLIHDDV